MRMQKLETDESIYQYIITTTISVNIFPVIAPRQPGKAIFCKKFLTNNRLFEYNAKRLKITHIFHHFGKAEAVFDDVEPLSYPR